MINFIRGTVVSKNNDYVVIECNGIGYKVSVSDNTLNRIAVSAEMQIFTYMSVSENAIGLYGFLSNDELSMFNMLISVSGIGPKVALQILSSFTPSELMIIIIGEDSKTMATAKGVGTKTAQRIIIDLKDKMKEVSVGNDKVASLDIHNEVDDNSVVDAIDALIVLGYSKMEAVKAVNSVYKEDADVQSLIKESLKVLNIK